MVTIDDITGFFLDNSSDSRKVTKYDFKGILTIESWVVLEQKGKVIIKGRIHNHKKHPQGVNISTSGVKGYFSERGRVYVTTKNSIYELGQPLNEVELVIKVPELQNPEKMTIWN
ncbi:hypothetical protein [Acaryochloris sp. IP29b_bin.137]|uniref:hypothetical protein n=1 Tax=Acaryochloris sp. IP29b_bin.137 TaxID=2969217 RepID=UPI00262EE18C|nr:hypothetical protein [Acaryochloris sp. IP29b_bin.137]